MNRSPCGPLTAAERQARRRRKIAEQGLKIVSVIVPRERESEIKLIAARMRQRFLVAAAKVKSDE